ncbi:hypothetical protein Tco_1461209 [Tanacetum coccineum]
MRKINFKKEVTQKFREYDQKLEALTNINVFEAFEKIVQARVLIEIKKLLPTHIPTTVANYVRPYLNTSVLEVVKNNQISLFTKSSTIADDLSDMDLKIKLLNKIYLNKSNDTHTTHHAAKRRTTWFDLLLKSDIDQNKNNIRGPSTVTIPKKLKARIQKDELTIPNLEGAGLEKLKQQYKNDVELEYHVDQLKAAMLSEPKWDSNEDDVTKEKYTTSLTKHYAARYYIQGIEDMISDGWCKETHHYHFEAHNGIHHWEDGRIYFFKAKMSNRSEGKVYSYLRIKSVIRIVAKKK